MGLSGWPSAKITFFKNCSRYIKSQIHLNGDRECFSCDNCVANASLGLFDKSNKIVSKTSLRNANYGLFLVAMGRCLATLSLIDAICGYIIGLRYTFCMYTYSPSGYD